ncbi:MAG TPA: hypothetical protein PLP73_03160, partial [Candidatus Absconditabacterales bacterium]|nr:hypothetical protein [Candidatus Absconditabacterales bacterium]
RSFRYVCDCIMVEYMLLEEFKNKYKGKKGFKNVDQVSEESFKDNQRITVGGTKGNIGVELKSYYNEQTQDRGILANDILILKSKMLYKHGKLPFVLSQHYPNPFSAYGIGVAEKVAYLQNYKSDMLQYALDRAKMGSGVNILTGNDSTPDEERYTGSGEVNIRRTNGGVDQIKQFQIDGNISSFANMLQIIDDVVIQDTGENIKAPYSSPANTLGEVEIMEENKMTRVASVDESDDLGMQEALTMCLSNITQYAPRLLKTEKTVGGKEIVSFPTIILPNFKAQVKEGKIEVEEDYGNYGSFEFKDDMIKGEYRVRIVTPNTGNSLKALEKNSITQYIQNMMSMAQADMTGETLKKIDFESLKELMDFIYGYDGRFMSETKKSKITKAVQNKMSEILSLINGNNDQNLNNTGVPTSIGGEGVPFEQNGDALLTSTENAGRDQGTLGGEEEVEGED